MASFWITVALMKFISLVTSQSTLSLQFSDTPNGNVSDFVDPSFAGFGIEPSNLFSFTGGSTPNQLTVNLLGNLANYTGSPAHIRLGGNTQDYMIYQHDQDAYNWVSNPSPKGAGNFAPDSMIIGPKFFEVANRFPKGTPVTWGLNMGYNEPDYIQQIVLMAQQVLLNVPNLNLVSFEVGNEPDLYAQNGFRSGPWSGRVYTEEWLSRVGAIWQQVLRPQNIPSNFFEPACTASTIGTDFQIFELVTFDIDTQASDSSKSYISTWNQHDYYYYIGVTTHPITLDLFMDLDTTNDQFTAWVLQVEQARDTPYPYALREMGVVGPIGLFGITDVFGASLWTLNFFMYAATLNISTVQMHMTQNSNASAWQPIELYGQGPHVRPNYYAYAAFDQIIGPSCQAQVGGYEIGEYPTDYDGRLRVYSVLQAGKLDTMVIINSKPVNASEPDKANLTVELALPTSLAGRTLHLAYLTADGADSMSGTTWNGISFEQSSDGTPTVVDDTDNTVIIGNDGTASITVRDSQAVAAAIDHRLGTGIEADQSACAAIASRSPPARASSGGSSGGSGGSDSPHNAASLSINTLPKTLLASIVATAFMTGILLVWT